MGTTFVTITDGNTGDEPGFWMRDSMLELWLRLLSFHLPEPSDLGDHKLTPEIRNRWMLASKGYFNGCVPHDMEFACSTKESRTVVKSAIQSLMKALDKDDSALDPNMLNLLGNEGCIFNQPIDRSCLVDIGYAFLDLIDGRFDGTAHSTEIMPGSKPYPRQNAT
ncbi:hypothetical protein OAG76_01415 [Rubripirellula sp.]|nr:hypothetical protein [Rubripirellula sp.]MDB4634041.1 hypothetical protein [Rubripirellula sp.]